MEFTSPLSSSHPVEDSNDELIDVVRIRLRNPAKGTVLLSDFRCADKILASWAHEASCDQVEFEVTFFDGYIVRGSYPFARTGKRKRSLGAQVSHMLSCITATTEDAPAHGLLRYLIAV